MDTARSAKRKVMEEILEMAKGGMVDELKAKKPKAKPPDAVAVEVKEDCPDCKEGDCEEHDPEGFKSKVAGLYEKLTADEE